MKKMFIFVLLLISVLLVGCSPDETNLQDTFLFEVIDVAGDNVFTKEIVYLDDLGVFGSILEVVDVDYDTSEYGAFVNGIENNYPKENGVTYNYYYSLYVNDEMQMIGIDQVEYSDYLKISFIETTTLSELDLLVDSYIELFLDELVDSYLNEDSFNQYVLASLLHFDKYGYYNLDFNDYSYKEQSLSNISGNLFQSLINNATDKVFSNDELDNIRDLDSSNGYELITLVNLLDILDESFDEQKEAVIDKLVNTDFPFLDSDTAGMILTALSSVSSDEKYETYIDEKLTYLKDNQTKDGVLSFGSENPVSTAQMILGLLSLGLNPTDKEFTISDVNLVEALMNFKEENGFIYNGKVDLMFSTPQAFSALSMYKIYRDQKTYSNDKIVNIWNYN